MDNYEGIWTKRKCKGYQQLIENVSEFSLAMRKENIERLLKKKRESKLKECYWQSEVTNNNEDGNANEDCKMVELDDDNNLYKININELHLPSQFEIDLYNYYSSVTIL